MLSSPPGRPRIREASYPQTPCLRHPVCRLENYKGADRPATRRFYRRKARLSRRAAMSVKGAHRLPMKELFILRIMEVERTESRGAVGCREHTISSDLYEMGYQRWMRQRRVRAIGVQLELPPLHRITATIRNLATVPSHGVRDNQVTTPPIIITREGDLVVRRHLHLQCDLNGSVRIELELRHDRFSNRLFALRLRLRQA